MTDTALRVGLLIAAVILAIGAIVADTNVASAVPLAAGAGIALAAYVILSVIGQTRFVRAPFLPPVTDPLVALRTAFRSGPLGRQRIAVAVLELQREAFGRTAARAAEGASARPEEMSASEFRRWVGEQLDELERTT